MSKPEAGQVGAADKKSLEWELLSREQAGRLLDIGPFDLSDGLRRMDRGDPCYTVCIDRRLAHYSWVQRSGAHPITEAGLTLPVEDGEFWIYNCQTADWARGKRIYPATLVRIMEDHFARGYNTAWIYTGKTNVASRKGILRAGFRHVATLRALRVGRFYFPLGRMEIRASSVP
ncbi:MAG: hypothetical protein IT166_22340 [Bryobacterales bacterium]|nr:hypothetical protein [Bryobacterales bacterium]